MRIGPMIGLSTVALIARPVDKTRRQMLVMACGMALISRPQSDTSLHCETTDMRLVYRVKDLFTLQLSLVLIVPMQ